MTKALESELKDEELVDWFDARDNWLRDLGRMEGDVLKDEYGVEYINMGDDYSGLYQKKLPPNLQESRKPF